MIESDTAATRGRLSNRFRGFSEASRPPSLRPLLGDRLLERRWAGIAPARLPSPIGPPRTQSLARAPPFVARSALTASHRAFNLQETFALSASRATCWTSCIDPRPQARKIEAFQQAQRSFHPTSRDQRCVMLNLSMRRRSYAPTGHVCATRVCVWSGGSPKGFCRGSGLRPSM